MRRFFIEEIRPEGAYCTIGGSAAKHIATVLRMNRGDRFVLMDGHGKRYQAIIHALGDRRVRVLLEKPLPPPPASPVHITLCQAQLKSRPMDYVIQKASELGVDVIVPFTSARSVARLARDRRDNKMRHWREIARAAAMQSDRGRPAAISNPCNFHELMARWKGARALKVILWEEEGRTDLKVQLAVPRPADGVVAVIGPEGGFLKEEIATAQGAGFVPVSLGKRVLRAETAAVTVAAVVQYEWGDLNLTRP